MTDTLIIDTVRGLRYEMQKLLGEWENKSIREDDFHWWYNQTCRFLTHWTKLAQRRGINA